jgi:hypothetical protein
MGHIDSSHAGRPADAAPDADNNLGRGAPHDRQERIRQKRRNEAQSISKDESIRRRGHRASSKARPLKRGE